MSCENGCQGHCCEDFILMYSPEELQALDGSKWNPKEKVEMVQSMVEYLGYYTIVPEMFKSKYTTNLETKKPGHHYRCKLQDPDTKLCTVYEDRPNVCRVYPNGHECQFKNCTIEY